MPPTIGKRGEFLPFGIEPLENECEEIVNGNDRGGGTYCCKPSVAVVHDRRVCKFHKRMYDKRAERDKKGQQERIAEQKLHDDTKRRAKKISKQFGVDVQVHYHVGFGFSKCEWTSQVRLEIEDLEKIVKRK